MKTNIKAEEKQNARLIYSDLSLKQGFKKFLLNPLYILPVVLSTVLCYTYYLTHETVTIDSLSSDRYYHGLLVAQGRLTATIIENFLGFEHLPIIIENIIGLICFILGATVLCIIFDRVKPQNNILPYTFFTSIFITFPLLNEYFMFKGAVLITGGSILLVSLALYFALKIKNFFLSIIVSGCFIFFAFSWYETFALVYIGSVFLILILLADSNKKQGELFLNGFWLAPHIIIGCGSEMIISRIILVIFNIEPNTNNSNDTYWFYDSTDLKTFFYDFLYSFAAKFFCYTPITIVVIFLAISLVLMICQIKKTKKPILILFYIGLSLTVFLLSLYRGTTTIYRAEQGMPFYTSAVALLLSSFIIRLNKKRILKAATSLCLVGVIIIQICSSNYWYHTNVIRDREEKQVVLNVAQDLEKYDKNKPVVFIGIYNLSDETKSRIKVKPDSTSEKIIDFLNQKPHNGDFNYYICDTSIRSYIAWSATVFSPMNIELKKFFNVCGYDFKLGTNEQIYTASKIAINSPAYPQKGYITETDDYIIVKLGNYNLEIYELLYNSHKKALLHL